MTKSRIEKQRINVVRSFGDNPENFSEEGLKIRYKFYGSIFNQGRATSSKVACAKLIRNIIEKSAKENIPRLLLPIAKQLNHLEYRLHFRCFEQNLSVRNKNSPKVYSLNCSLFAIKSIKRPIKRAKNSYKIRNAVFIGNVIFEELSTIPKNLPNIFSRLERREKIKFLENFSNDLYYFKEAYLFSKIFAYNMKDFPINLLPENTTFGYMKKTMCSIFERFENDYEFDLNDDVLGGDFDIAYLISKNPKWAISFSQSLWNTVFSSTMKLPSNVDSEFMELSDLNIRNFVKILYDMGLIEIENLDFEESDIKEILSYNKMMKY